jgi:hypothetical protein
VFLRLNGLLAPRDPDARAGGAHRCRGARDRPQQAVVRRHRGQCDDEGGDHKARERKRGEGHGAPPRELRVGSRRQTVVDRPRGQLAAEQEQDGHQRRRGVGMVLHVDDERDVGAGSQPEREGEAAAAAEKRDDERQRPESGGGNEERRGRPGAGERQGDDAAVGRGRTGRGRYAGRARCRNAFTSSSEAARGTPSRQVTTGTPTCS